MKKRYWIAILCAVLALVLTVAAASADEGDVYGLATGASDLHNGDRIILVSDDGSYYQAMATDFSGMQVIVTGNAITEQDGMLALTLTETEDGWLLASNDGYLAVDGGALTIVSDQADAAVWSISIASDGTATVSCVDGDLIFAEQNGAYRFFCGEGGNPVSVYGTSLQPGQHVLGDNLWWTSSNGKLTIGGNGSMPSFSAFDQPWKSILSEITEIEILDGVTNIGDHAFYGCSGLMSITMPCSATIGPYAFGSYGVGGCWAIKDVRLTKGTGTMTYYSMNSTATNYYIYTPWYISHDNDLTISLDDGIQNIGSCAFYNCTRLTAIVIPDSVTSIGVSGFEGCTGLTSITIPDGVKSIGSYAFRSCTGLTSITIPGSVTSIGTSAFAKCTGLTSIMLPDGVTSINGSVFYDCTGLTTITIPDGVTSIGDYAFSGCTSLQSITIPSSASFSKNAFAGCAAIITVHLTKGTGTMSSYSTDSTATNYYQNTPWYISRNNALTIILDEGIQNIGDYAFYNCMGLQSIPIPGSVTSIGTHAFAKCTGLTEITIPDGITSIEDLAFYNCTGLKSITIPDSVTSIGSSAFSGCTSLESVTIGSGVTIIEPLVFGDCTSLSEITIPDSVTSICLAAFQDCTSLSEITIPDSVTFIDECAFFRCTGLTEITIPDSVTFIGISAFSECTSLSEITIADGVTSIDGHAFYKTAWWNAQNDGLVYLDYILLGVKETCGQIIRIKDGTKLIAGSAFFNKTLITKVTIPDSVTSIGDNAFADCTGLQSVTIGNSVTSIGNYAFSDCTGLTDVYYSGTEAQRQSIAISFGNAPLLNATWHYLPAPAGVTITLDPCNGDDPTTVTITVGGTLSELPVPEYEGYQLIGWFLDSRTGLQTGTGTEVTLETVFNEDTTIYANWYMPGDINGDGKVNNKDVNRLLQYLAGDDVTVVLFAYDINGDTKINNKDVNRLLQYLAGDDVEIY